MTNQRSIKLQKEMNKLLAEAPDSRVFLSEVYKLFRGSSPSYSFASFARRCQFSSRSFARQLLIGEKRLTQRSLPQVIKGLKLNLGAAKILEAMVQVEHENNPQQREQLLKKLNKYKQVMEKRLAPTMTESLENTVFLHNQWPFVYASLNSSSHQSVDEIARKAKLAPEQTKKILETLLQAGLIREEQGRYFTEQAYLELNDMVESDFSKKFFLQGLDMVKIKAQKCFGSDQSCYFTSVVSLSKQNFPKFSLEFQDLLNKYCSDIEEQSGDTLFTVTAAFTEH